MPAALTYPGVYIEEIPSGVRTITGVATSITAFIGRTQRGSTNKAVTINNFSDFERIFGGLWLDSSLGYAVRDFYLNGGSQAIIVRLFHDISDSERQNAQKEHDAAQAVADATTGADASSAASAARAKANTFTNDPEKSAADKVAKAAEDEAGKTNPTLINVQDAAKNAIPAPLPSTKAKLPIDNIKLEAANEGSWGANLRVVIDFENIPTSSTTLFNLTVTNSVPSGSSERFLNLSTENNSTRRIDKVLGTSDGSAPGESQMVKWEGTWPSTPISFNSIRKEIEDIVKEDGTLNTKKKALETKTADPNAKENEVKTAFTELLTEQDKILVKLVDSITFVQSTYAYAKATYENLQNKGNIKGEILKAIKEVLDDKKKVLDNSLHFAANSATDGKDLTINDFLPPQSKIEKKGMHALEQADLFNLLCIPPYKENKDVDKNLLAAADAYCAERRAMLLVDPHSSWTSKDKAREEFSKADDSYPGIPSKNAALFFPRLKQPNPLRDNQVEEFVPCGAIAGVFARTDTQRGVWKAPAGLEATLAGVPQLSVNLTDAENGELNPLGINCLRSFPIIGRIAWGSRTLRGADQLADEWKYIPVRRTALFLEESLFRGLKWVVFEPNDEPLWAQIRLNVGAFMNNLFRQGAFQGRTAREAYLVKCNNETTNQNDINLGIVNVVVGFAPLKPAEFVVIKIQQLAGQIQV